jgi:hypothetical protein
MAQRHARASFHHGKQNKANLFGSQMQKQLDPKIGFFRIFILPMWTENFKD